jgi:WD40 repeat protein
MNVCTSMVHCITRKLQKGSIPINTIKAHDSKIYGISWSRLSENEITSCSLDKSIKSWNICQDASRAPLSVINTDYPIWRARNLPFGRGVLAQPHRGRRALDMYSANNTESPVHIFEGFTSLVAEYVWRVRGGSSETSGRLFCNLYRH